MDKDTNNNGNNRNMSDEDLIKNILDAKSKVEKYNPEIIDNYDEDEEDEENSENKVDNTTEKINSEFNPKIPNNKKKKRVKKKSFNFGKFIFGVSLTAVIVSIATFSALFIIKVGKDMLGIDKPETEVVFQVPKNATTEDIATLLFEKGVITEPLAFRAISRLNKADGTYIAGTHKIRANMAYQTIISNLQTPALEESETVEVTFPEGINLFAISNILEKAEICKAKDFIYACNTKNFDYDFEKLVTDGSLKFYKMEGYVFPDTYKFYKKSEIDTVIKKIYQNFESKITPELYKRMDELGMTLDETITLASVIQAEAPVFSEMKNVSAVFHNRLNDKDNFPLLQSDPTSKYVEEVIKPNIEIDNEDMFKAYDTYIGTGLPPGAICNPGIEAIEAALYPTPEFPHYFFCSNLETREFFYAETNSKHEQNLVKANLV